MNNQSPFVPQGSLMEQKKQGRARVKLAVFCVLAVQGVGLLALLMQGCRRDDKETQASAEVANTNVAPVFEATTPVVADTATMPATTAAGSNSAPAAVVDPAVGAATEYVIKAGDNFTTIGRNFHVSAKAIADANPGVEATKIKPGQKLHIPPPTVAATPVTPTVTPTTDTAKTEGMYKVRTGDTLIKIASTHHTTVRALRAANSLRTDNIKVGQVLKIPSAASGTTVATSQTNPAT
jgi:LysM repeat protein